MKTIAFYISNHGFGHASRNIPIVRHLLEEDPTVSVVIKSDGEPFKFMQQSLKDFTSRIAFNDSLRDIGLILKEGSFDVDPVALEDQVREYVGTWTVRVAREKDFLLHYHVKLIVSDVIPWVFASAHQAKIPSVIISNFTWAEIYQGLFDQVLVDEYRNYYGLADWTFLYPFSMDMPYLGNVFDVGLSCREFNYDRVKKLRETHTRPLVYLSLGRAVQLDGVIDVSQLPYDFFSTSGVQLNGHNVHILPADTLNTHDYIMASDYVISKAGWGTVSEAICARKPMLIIRRDEVAEDRTTLAKLLKLGIALPIGIEDLHQQGIESALHDVESRNADFARLSDRYMDCSGKIAGMLLELLEKGA